jgi:hypothetical protein
VSTRAFKIAWATWAAVGAGLEVWALKDTEKGDTLTDQVRAILKRPFLWWAGAGLAVWAFRHFFFNKP